MEEKWLEFSFRKYNNRLTERELDVYEKENYTLDDLEQLYGENVKTENNGVYEDLTLDNCSGIENWWKIMEEFN